MCLLVYIVCTRHPISLEIACNISHDCLLLAAVNRGCVYENIACTRIDVLSFCVCMCLPQEIENTPNSVDAAKRDNVSRECESDPLSVATGC